MKVVLTLYRISPHPFGPALNAYADSASVAPPPKRELEERRGQYRYACGAEFWKMISPKTYEAYYTPEPHITFDGTPTEWAWERANVLTACTSPWEQHPLPGTEFLPYPDRSPNILGRRLERELIRQTILMTAARRARLGDLRRNVARDDSGRGEGPEPDAEGTP